MNINARSSQTQVHTSRKSLKALAAMLIAMIMVPVLSFTFTPDWASANTREAESVAQVRMAQDQNGSGDQASSVLDGLPLKGRAPKTGYKRAKFGRAWADVDRNGCDTRNDILGRDLKDKRFKRGTGDCKVMSGTLDDPYTGKVIDYQQGAKTSSRVQIDHVVALSNAWQTGAQKLTEAQRTQMANDPYNLLAVDGPSNQQKSDGDAATWLPANKSYRCDYVSRQIGVKRKYGLWVTSAEKAAMQRVLATCPAQQVPADNGPFVGKGVTASSASSSDGGGSSAAPSPVPSTSSQEAPQNQSGDVYYANCSVARAAGKAPLTAGQPGYRTALDRDHDGVACE